LPKSAKKHILNVKSFISTMTTINISLPEQMRLFVEEQVAAGGYSTTSEYIRSLIRQDNERKNKEQLDALLLQGLASGESIEVTEQWWDEKRAALMAKIQQTK
jgi:antitoxin ParD1/3/4